MQFPLITDGGAINDIYWQNTNIGKIYEYGA